MLIKKIKAISKIVDHAQRQGENDSAEPFGRELLSALAQVEGRPNGSSQADLKVEHTR